MAEDKREKWPKKSEKYRGIYQRKNGSWFYRIKRVDTFGEERYYQESGFRTEEDANTARNKELCCLPDTTRKGFDLETADTTQYEKFLTMTFGELFQEFIEVGVVQSDKSIEKYKALYNAQLSAWADLKICDISDQVIDLLLLKLTLKESPHKGKNEKYPKRGYSKSYIDSVRKLIVQIFKYARWVGYEDSYTTGAISREKYKLRVLSLFSGIGAPEQALKNLGVDFELVNFCEIDLKASKAYCLLHNVEPDKNLIDIVKASEAVYIPEKNRIGRTMYGVDAEDDIEETLTLPKYDIMFFGFPCQNISSAGNRKGLRGESSGLFFKAMDIAFITKPKFLIAENVKALLSKNMQDDFDKIIEEFEDCGYKHYHINLRSEDFGVPQKRNRVFMVMVREDLNIDFQWPEPIPLTDRAENYFDTEVADEYYCSPEQLELIERLTEEGNSFKPNYERDIIPTITTGWGTPSYTRQTFIVDEKGTRCLSSEELMVLQGFTKEQGRLLRDNGFSKNQVGKLVGNSITVPVLEAILKQLFNAL